MNSLILKLKKVALYIHLRIHLFIFLLSLISLSFVFLKITKINIILGFSEILLIELIFGLLVIFSTIFIILFLPTYPIFFLIYKKSNFNFLEKLSITIVINSVFIIFTGYIGYWINIPLTEFYFLYSVVLSYFPLMFYIFFKEIQKGTYNLFVNKNFNEYNQQLNTFSFFKYLKKRIPFNGILLITFIFLICILNIVKSSYFIGTDPWLHVLNSRIITDINILPLEGYHGTLGLNIFGAVIHFFSGIDHILIPKLFVFYTFFVSALIFYNISKRIFKNQNLAFCGVFLLEFSSLGFSAMMIQYWPSGSALIKCLMIFFLLYVRFQKLIELERPTKRIIFSDMAFIYITITLIFISAVLTHVITSLFFLISFLMVYFIYFIKDYRRGIDFIFLIGLFGIFLILNFFGIGSEHYWFFIPLNFPIYILLLAGSVGIIAGIFILLKLKKSISFSKGTYKSIINGKEKKYYKKIEDKVIIPLIFSFLILVMIIFLIVNLIWLNLAIINIFYVSEIVLISAFAIWGLFLFQKKPKGKLLYLWGLGLALLLLVGFIFNILVLSNMIWQRILYLIPPIIVIGFISYLYKLIKLKSISMIKIKVVVLFIMIFSLFTTYFYESNSYKVFTLKKRDINPIQWYSNNTDNKNGIISERGWSHAFKYYEYPFENQTEALIYEENFYFLKFPIDVFPPSNHINESGVNILKEIKIKYNTDVYLIFEGEYIINKEFELFGRLTREESDQYYQRDYINKIYSTRIMNGKETPLFWII